jgi:dihydroorotate dehydrogenase electron transfer subunit
MISQNPDMMITSLPQPAHIVEIADESPSVRTLVSDLRLEAEPGQFVMAWLPGIDEKPFSLVRADPVTLTIARVGPFTDAVFSLGIGDRLWLRGPLGQPFTLPSQQSPTSSFQLPILLVAGGYGVAPLHFLARLARDAGWPVAVVVGARTATDVVFVDRFAALDARVVVTTDDGSLGEQGLATDAAGRLLAEVHHQAIYACGPASMLDAVEILARAYQVPTQLSHERYMRCGFGVCGSCSHEGWLVCRDGPVKSI